MFGNSKSNGSTSTGRTPLSTSASSAVNQFSEGTLIIGTISAKSDLRIDGIFEGELRSESKVVIGKNGKVKGKISCSHADIQGVFEGEIKVESIIALRESSIVSATIQTGKIVIETGAKFNGSCLMKTSNAADTVKPKSTTPEKV